MLDGIFIISIFSGLAQGIKEAFEPTIPAENWANKELYYKDIANGVPIEQRMKNVENGKYKPVNKYPEPHRNPVDGSIIIENSQLYYDDVKKYGAYQASKWMEQGKYNLTPEELKKEKERIQKKYERLYSYR